MYAFWLILEKSDQRLIQGIINDFGKRFEAPSFLPHITVYGLVNTKLEYLSTIAEEISSNFKPFKVKLLNLAYSDEIWKTLYINIKLDKNLNTIYHHLQKNLRMINDYKFEPHLSLIYKKIPLNEKKEIISNFELKQSVKIDKICIFKYSRKINEWKIVDLYPLQKISSK